MQKFQKNIEELINTTNKQLYNIAPIIKRGTGLKSPDKNFRNLFPIVKQHF